MDQAFSDLQDEVKVLKNEIKETLVSIRDHLLTNVENPFPTDLRREAAAPQGARPAPALPRTPATDTRRDQEMDTPEEQPAHLHEHRHEPIDLSKTGAAVNATVVPTTFGPQPGPMSPVNGSPKAPWEMETDRSGQQNAGPGPMPNQPTRPTQPTQPDQQQQPQEPSFSVPPITGQAPDPTEQESVSSPASDDTGTREEEDTIDLLTVAMLANWVEEGLAHVGRERLQGLVEIYGSMGGISLKLQGILGQLMALGQDATPEEPVSLRDCIRVLVDLDALIWRSRTDGANAALLTSLMGRSGVSAPLANALGAGMNRGNGRNGGSHANLLASLLAL